MIGALFKIDGVCCKLWVGAEAGYLLSRSFTPPFAKGAVEQREE
jgi:hypothetical protein